MAAIQAIVGAVFIFLSVLGYVKFAPNVEVLPLRWDSLASITVSTGFIILVWFFAFGWWLVISCAYS